MDGMVATNNTDGATHQTILRSTKKDGVAANRVGRRTIGIYPRVSRTKLAAELGKKTATVSRYFLGLKPMPLSVAVRVATMIGVSVGELNVELERVARRRRRAGRNKQVAA